MIDAIYEASLHPEGWAGVVLALEEVLKGPTALVVQRERPVGAIAAASAAEERHISSYLDHYWSGDRAMMRMRVAPVGEILRDSELVTDSERGRLEFYSDYLGEIDAHRGIYASLLKCGEETITLGAHRRRCQDDFDQEDKRLLGRLLPHLSRSLQIHRRMEAAALQRHSSVQALDHAAIGLIIVSRDANVRYANRIAEDHLRGGGLGVSRNRLHASTPSATRDLHAAIAGAAIRPGGVAASVTIPVLDPSETIHIIAAPVQAESEIGSFTEPMAMLILGKPTGATIPDDRLRKAYGLTAAEARLLSALVAGERLSAYAERTRISITTAKFHLSALFAKTGVRRQTDLIRLALADPVLRLHIDPATM
ncbi:helix-turn-helix transcriptional regulator [Sphingomonas cavernae]|uniref:HTH luxR-type domain-containing protein n=1 Tax=Sphingomonas cavernae TaxID=2320861 RepID=A0A418WKR7_9SPHN|nr:hypothetical protein [Sphingomonas cavernae]RJF90610.1 hypothetical protein D3876_10325 [Sphingomonas cavernae]